MEEQAEKYCEKWNLSIEKEIRTFSANVYLARQGNKPVVLKLPHSTSDEALQVKVLQCYDGKGSVKVLTSDPEAVLLERLIPGRHLVELVRGGRDEQATQVFCQITKQLHSAKGDLSNFKSIADLALGFDRYLATGVNTIALQEVIQAKELFLSLLSSQAEPVLLHGDLHHDNILQDDIRGWVAIDPKGYVGEPVYEAGALLRNPIRPQYYASKTIIESRVEIMTQEMGWNERRIINWTYAQAVLSAIWSIEDGQDPKSALVLATVLKEMI